MKLKQKTVCDICSKPVKVIQTNNNRPQCPNCLSYAINVPLYNVLLTIQKLKIELCEHASDKENKPCNHCNTCKQINKITY